MAQQSRLKLGTARCGGVEGRIDIVRAGLGSLDRQAAAAQAPQAAPSVSDGLAGARARRRDDQATRAHGSAVPRRGRAFAETAAYSGS